MSGRLSPSRGESGSTVTPRAEPVSEAPGQATAPSGRRRAIVWALIGLAALVALASSLTVWVKEQVLDTEAWTEASGDLLANDEIRSALAISLSDALLEGSDVTARLEARLPPDLDALAPPIAGLLGARAPEVAGQLLSTPAALAIWEDINRRVHARLVDLLENGDGEAVTLEESGDVVLDLQPLVERLAGRLGLEVELDAGAGEITIMRTDQLAAAQDAVRTINVLTAFLGLVVIALLVLAVYLARGFRREALRASGLALLVVGLILLVVRRVVGDEIVEALTSAQTEPAGSAVWLIATDLLQNVSIALVAYGAAVLVGAWLAGTTRPAVAIRRTLAPVLRGHPVLVYSGVFVAVLLALYFGPAGDTRRLYGILILCGLVVVGVEALRRQTAREFPAGTSGR